MFHLLKAKLSQKRSVFADPIDPLSDQPEFEADLESIFCETLPGGEDLSGDSANIRVDGNQSQCMDCGKTFSARNSALRHWLTSHRPVPLARRECPVCGKSLKEIYTLRGHLRKIHGITKPKKNWSIV